ncbi:uncharacterized protein VTP21DRAFT_6445 [Calcarisporiella thermophila]|uniref:uncharacterized protein n=1 Tax=Calcarisporiella thermophila TaxID=911321 RepID=UPI0037448862
MRHNLYFINSDEQSSSHSRARSSKSNFEQFSETFVHRPGSQKNILYPPINPDLTACTELVLSFEKQWQVIRETNQENYEKAREAEDLILALFRTFESQNNACDLMEKEADLLPEVRRNLDEVATLASTIQLSLARIERLIESAESEQEVISFEDWKRSQAQEFEAYQREKMREYERKKRELNERKSRRLQTAFEERMREYARQREGEPQRLYQNVTIQRPPELTSSALYQLELEDTLEDRNALDAFLDEDDVGLSDRLENTLIVNNKVSDEPRLEDRPLPDLLPDEDYSA